MIPTPCNSQVKGLNVTSRFSNLYIFREAVVSSPDEDTNADLTEEDLKQIAKEQMDSTQVENLYD